MSKKFARGLAWFFAVVFVLDGATYAITWATDKKGEVSLGPGATLFILGGLWCAYLYGSGINNRNMGAKAKRQEADDLQAIEAAAAAPLEEVHPRQALLKQGEKAYGAIEATLQEEKTIGYSAGTQGVSLRVAKGLTVRSSGTRAMPVKGMVEVAKGELVITDKRVIFAGDRKSFVLANADLINTTNYSDGFGFTDGTKTYTLTTAKGREHGLFAIAVHKILRA